MVIRRYIVPTLLHLTMTVNQIFTQIDPLKIDEKNFLRSHPPVSDRFALYPRHPFRSRVYRYYI